MKVTVNAGGRVVEIEANEPDMTVHRLANIAISTWRRTEPDEPESLGPAIGFTSQLGTQGRGYRHFRMGRTPLDAS